LDVAALVEDRRRARGRRVQVRADRAGLREALVDPDRVLELRRVTAVRERRVPVAVEVDVREVDVLAEVAGAQRHRGRVPRELLRVERGAETENTQAGHAERDPGVPL